MFNKWIVKCIILMALVLLVIVTVPLALPARVSEAGPNAPGEDLGTGFTYQGQLNLDGRPVNSTCDLQFSLYDDELGSVQVGTTQTITGVEVSGGLFTVQLDFGASAFQGDARWLSIQVQCQGDAAYADLGLQALTATPYALHALSAPWDGISGIPSGFADGTDDVAAVVSGTAVYAGEGLNQIASGDAVTLSVAPSYRLPQTCAGGQLAEWDGAAWVCGDDDTGSGGGDYWSLAGNAGTDPSTHFLGTSDGVSLTLAVSGTPALRLEPTGGTPNLIGGSEYNTVTLGVVGSVIGGGGNSDGPNRVMGDYATIGGGGDNLITANYGTIAGGHANAITDTYGAVGGGYGNTAGGSAVVGGGYQNTASGWYTIIGGGFGNTASGYNATVGGGYSNDAGGWYATVPGGFGNDASGDRAAVGGGAYNIASGVGAFIGGGGYDGDTYSGNEALGDASTIGGGLGNVVTVTGNYATIGGGRYNTASGSDVTVSGGFQNTASAWYATVGGGFGNAASGERASVGGGAGNEASGYFATVSGGTYNTAGGPGAFVGGGGYDGGTFSGNDAHGTASTIGGGFGNVITVTASYGTIAGGRYNVITGTYGTVGGGSYNQALASYATIAGGGPSSSHDPTTNNRVYDDYGTIGGGGQNRAGSDDGDPATARFATVAGGSHNTANDYYATIGGGEGNTASSDRATVGGGYLNTASGEVATVGGGSLNTASGDSATVGGGVQNEASADTATVGGGSVNDASGAGATVGGGSGNTAGGIAAAVGGGYGNTASGGYATVPGGYDNTASGDYSFAVGRRAQANHDGAIILADSNNFDFTSLTANTFKVRATGGIRFVLGIDGSGAPTWSCLVQDGSSWSCSSDRNLKENLDLVEGGEVLQRLAEMPIYTWNGKGQDPALRHMGPMAQDFYAAFNLGGDDTHIATVDLDGVALAAVQGLYAQNRVLEMENANLHQRVDDLEARLSALETQVAGGSATSPVQANLLPGAGLFLVGGVGLWLVCSRQHSEPFDCAQDKLVKGEDER